MCTNGSSARRSTPAKARRTGKPSPSRPEGAVVTEITGRSAAWGPGSGTRGRAMVSLVTAGIVRPPVLRSGCRNRLCQSWLRVQPSRGAARRPSGLVPGGRVRDGGLTASSGSRPQRGGVARLVQAELATAWELDGREQSPALVADRAGELDAIALQLFNGGVDVSAHQVQLEPRVPVGRVSGQFGWRQGEDRPAASRVARGEPEHVV